MNQLKAFLHELIPPFLLKAMKGGEKYGYFGQYSSWQEAKQDTVGYDADLILQKVKESLLKVKYKEAVYERDSVLFEQIQHSYPLLASLLRVAVENQNKLSVLDFGGSLGSSYYQCKGFLSVLKELRWNIVEQEKFFTCGQQYFEDNELKFFKHIESCLKSEKPNVILLSSVLQYLEKPYDFLSKMISYNFDYIIFDRTAFLSAGSDRLTIQKVSPEIYEASYPAWFFNMEQFLSYFQDQYELIFQFDALAGVIELKKPYAIAHDKGFFFQRKDVKNAPH